MGSPHREVPASVAAYVEPSDDPTEGLLARLTSVENSFEADPRAAVTAAAALAGEAVALVADPAGLRAALAGYRALIERTARHPR